jgi:hypothetical protein
MQHSWDTAQQLGIDKLSAEEIDGEIAAVRQVRLKRPVEFQQ